jgi:hypothetical protein
VNVLVEQKNYQIAAGAVAGEVLWGDLVGWRQADLQAFMRQFPGESPFWVAWSGESTDLEPSSGDELMTGVAGSVAGAVAGADAGDAGADAGAVEDATPGADAPGAGAGGVNDV